MWRVEFGVRSALKLRSLQVIAWKIGLGLLDKAPAVAVSFSACTITVSEVMALAPPNPS